MKKFKTFLFTFILLAPAIHITAATDALRLTIAGNGFKDQTVIRFMDGATSGYDKNFDADKLFSTNKLVPAVYTMADSIHSLSSNTYPFLTGGKDIAVYTKNTVATNYTLSMEEFGAILPSITIFMEDIETGINHEMRSGKSFTFFLAANANANKARFILHMTYPSTIKINGASSDFMDDGSITISKPGDEKWNYFLSTNDGSIVKEDSIVKSNATIKNIFSGEYNLIIFSSHGEETFAVNIPNTSFVTGIKNGTGEAVPDNSLNVFPNPSNGNIAVSFKVDEESDLLIKVSDAQGKLVYSETKVQYTGAYQSNLDLTPLPKGIYVLSIVSDKGTTTKKIMIQ